MPMTVTDPIEDVLSGYFIGLPVGLLTGSSDPPTRSTFDLGHLGNPLPVQAFFGLFISHLTSFSSEFLVR
jgi:hypothetical protein